MSQSNLKESSDDPLHVDNKHSLPLNQTYTGPSSGSSREFSCSSNETNYEYDSCPNVSTSTVSMNNVVSVTQSYPEILSTRTYTSRRAWEPNMSTESLESESLDSNSNITHATDSVDTGGSYTHYKPLSPDNSSVILSTRIPEKAHKVPRPAEVRPPEEMFSEHYKVVESIDLSERPKLHLKVSGSRAHFQEVDKSKSDYPKSIDRKSAAKRLNVVASLPNRIGSTNGEDSIINKLTKNMPPTDENLNRKYTRVTSSSVGDRIRERMKKKSLSEFSYESGSSDSFKNLDSEHNHLPDSLQSLNSKFGELKIENTCSQGSNNSLTRLDGDNLSVSSSLSASSSISAGSFSSDTLGRRLPSTNSTSDTENLGMYVKITNK